MQKKQHVQRSCDPFEQVRLFCVSSIPSRSPRKLKGGLALNTRPLFLLSWSQVAWGILSIGQDSPGPIILRSSNVRASGAVNRTSFPNNTLPALALAWSIIMK